MFRPSAWFAGALAALAACTTGPMPKPHAETSDPFLWLEEVEGAKALEWVRAQNARSLALLEADPRYTAAEAQALAILNSKDRLALGTIRNGYVYNFWQDEAHVRGLWRRMPLAAYRRGAPSEGGWETLLDIDALAAAEKANWVFQGVDCLGEDDRFCLVRLSDGGKDAHVQREFDVSKKAFTPGGFALPEAKSDATWADKDTLLVATDWGPDTLTESGYPFIVKRLRRGDPLSAAQEILRGDRTDVSAAPGVLEAPDGTRIPIAVVADTFFTSTNYRLDRNAPEKIDLPPRATLRALYKDQLIFTIEEDWRSFASGALLSMPAGETARAQAVQVIYAPGPREAIEGVDDAAGALLVSATRNVLGRLLAYDFDGARWTHKEIALPAGTVSYVAASAHARTAFAVSEAAITPETLFEIDAPGATAQPVRSLPAFFSAEGLVTRQYEATSSDGEKIPYFITGRPDAMARGDAPTLLYGYGGFQVSMNPVYSGVLGKVWLEAGGVYVLANIRGGGEFGPAWHQAGLKSKRQIVYDDFIAVAQDLIARKITNPRRLGIEGGSNGGLLMGVMLTQRPDLFNAAVVQVPLLDMLRYNQLLAGASWVDEYGSPNIPEERAWLEKMSPYQNLRKRKDFPVPFLVTSTKDDRVHPGHARKFAAKMESLGMAFLYYENIDGGHSAAANLKERAKRQALEFTYLKQRLMD